MLRAVSDAWGMVAGMSEGISFADITTIGVGGGISHFIEPRTRVGVIEAVEDADTHRRQVCMLGGGSNLLVGDAGFDGTVVRDARRTMVVLDEAAPVENGQDLVRVNAEAGCNWDDFVVFCVGLGLVGIEGLSGIPGTVGASVVQNIGAYGQEVSQSVESVEAWDRERKITTHLTASDMGFSYRGSALKSSMYRLPGVPAQRYFPSPRYIVLSVTFVLHHRSISTVGNAQLASALSCAVGARMDAGRIRSAVLGIRAAKGMLEDAHRYETEAMAGTKRAENIRAALRHQDGEGPASEGHSGLRSDRHSCGSFFMNPILGADQARLLPDGAPRFAVSLPGGGEAVKTSAAWLIDHAGFHRGFRVGPTDAAALSSVHTLALTNLGGARASDIARLAGTVQDGVEKAFHVHLVPEPVVVGLDLA
jgi:UDP-N-acetylmuramate dehydrogenase